MTLYFEDKNGVSRKLADVRNEAETMEEINKFIAYCNKGRKKPFKPPYVRTWEDDGKKWYDVGSHSEYFYVS